MKLSARNVFSGKVVEVTRGQTTGHVRVEIAPGIVITSAITMAAIDDLAIKVGDRAHAIIKSSDVIIGKD
jgi:molybdopterin-binding protein